jgi:SAM-dependent methyltransferase
MQEAIRKTTHSLRTIGLGRTLSRMIRYVQFTLGRRTLRQQTREILRLERLEDRFTTIYRRNHWGYAESVSGQGSTLEHTGNLRRQLPLLFDRFSIRSVFDAPCGDLNWMKHVLAGRDMQYIGADIVEPLIADLQARHGSPGVRFMQADITRTPFPRTDLWICRDCLIHLSYRDTWLALQRFVESETPYLLTNTYVNPGHYFINSDIESGDFRRIDLFSAPYDFPPDVQFRFDDWASPEPPREMCLWTRAQVISMMDGFAARAHAR